MLWAAAADLEITLRLLATFEMGEYYVEIVGSHFFPLLSLLFLFLRKTEQINLIDGNPKIINQEISERKRKFEADPLIKRKEDIDNNQNSVKFQA